LQPFDSTGPEYAAALGFLKSYGAPQPLLTQLTEAQILALMPQLAVTTGVMTADVDRLLTLQILAIRNKMVADIIDDYNNIRIPSWLRNIVSFPSTPIPPIAAFPTVLPITDEVLFGSFGMDAAIVQNAPSLALRILRQAYVVPGDPNEYCPFPKPPDKVVDHRVIGDPLPGNSGWLTCGPDGIQFPNGYLYPTNAAPGVPRYRKYIYWANQATGGFWLQISN
jgi:hypothetical protein